MKSSADTHASDPVWLKAGNSFVFQIDITFSWFINTCNKVKYRGFTCSVRPDEASDLTGFNNLVSPFIRYRTGDIGIYTEKKSRQHPNWFSIKRIEGRKQDFIIDKDHTPKTAIHIDRPFWNIRNDIYAYQYIQDIPGKVTVNIHAKEKLNDNQIKEIIKIFKDTYFKFDIEVRQVDHISRTTSGKFRYLIQNIKDD